MCICGHNTNAETLMVVGLLVGVVVMIGAGVPKAVPHSITKPRKICVVLI